MLQVFLKAATPVTVNFCVQTSVVSSVSPKEVTRVTMYVSVQCWVVSLPSKQLL